MLKIQVILLAFVQIMASFSQFNPTFGSVLVSVLQLIMHWCNNITCICNFSQKPAKIACWESIKNTIFTFQRSLTRPPPTAGVRWIYVTNYHPEHGACCEIEKILSHVDDDVVDIKNARGDGAGTYSRYEKFLFCRLLSIVLGFRLLRPSVICINCFCFRLLSENAVLYENNHAVCLQIHLNWCVSDACCICAPELCW